MNNLKKFNYIQFKKFKTSDIQNKVLVFLHLDYIKTTSLQLFFSHCKENKINIIRFKLNFFKKILNNKTMSKLLNGPSLLVFLDPKDIEIIFKLQKEFDFFIILSFFYRNKFIKKNYVLKKLNNIEVLSKKLFVPSKYLSLFFFKRLNSLLPIVLIKPIFNIYILLKYKCQH